jgi:hypothetical protein
VAGFVVSYATGYFALKRTTGLSSDLLRNKRLANRTSPAGDRAEPIGKWQEVAGFRADFEHLSTGEQSAC